MYAYIYRGDIPETKSNGDAIFAFYEIKGLKMEASERYEGKRDGNNKRYDIDSLYRKAEGYAAKEHLIYRGGWKNDLQHGQGTLFWEDTSVDITTSSSKGKSKKLPTSTEAAAAIAASSSGSNSDNNSNDEIIHYVCRFRHGKLHGRGTEFDERGDKVSAATLVLNHKLP